MKPLLTFLLSIAAAGVTSAADATHHANRPATESTAPIELGASACFAPDGTLWAVHKISGHLAVSRSTDAGQSWANPVLVTAQPEQTDPGADARAKIAIGTAGEIYLTWTRPLARPFTGEIRFSRSLDHGATFSPATVVHRDRQAITHRFDALTVTPNGDLFVAWIDKRDLERSPDATYRGAAVYFAVSRDRGASFAGDYKVADHSCECCRIAIAPAPNDEVRLLWRHIFAPNIRDHATATIRADGTISQVARATFEDWRVDACPHHGPALAVDGSGRPHAVWFSGAASRRGLFHGWIEMGGREAPRQLGSVLAGHGDLAIAGQRIAIAWKEHVAGRTALRALVSSDQGRTWREHQLRSVDGPTDHPRVLVRGDRFHVFWNTAAEPLLVCAVPGEG